MSKKPAFSDDEVMKFAVPEVLPPVQPKTWSDPVVPPSAEPVAPAAKPAFTDDEVAQHEVQAPTFNLSLDSKPTAPIVLDDKNSYVNQYGGREANTLSPEEKRRIQALYVTDAPTFGHGDEIVGAMAALTGGDYSKAQQKAQDDKDRYMAARNSGEIPWDEKGNLASNAGGIVAGALPFGLLGAGAKGMVGAARGALTGSPLAKTAWGKGLDWLLAGGIAGTEMGALYESGEAPEQTVEGKAHRIYKAGMGPLGTMAVLNILGGGAGGVVARTGHGAATMLTSPAKAANRYLAETLHDAELTIPEIRASHAANQAINPKTSLDVAGPDWFSGWRRAGGVAAREMGSGDVQAQELLDRQLTASGRLANNAAEAGGKGGASFDVTFDDLVDQAKKAARPLYEKAFAHPPIMSPRLQQILDRPTTQPLLEQAIRAGLDSDIPLEQMVFRDAAGNTTGYSTQLMNFIKKKLDSAVNVAAKAGDTDAVSSLGKVRNDLLTETDKLNKLYAPARAAYAGRIKVSEALEAGNANKMLQEHPDRLRAIMSKMSPSELEFFRKGYIQRVIQNSRQTGLMGDAGWNMFSTGAKREAAETILGKEAYEKLAREANLEHKMNQSFGEVYANSKTAERIAASENSQAQSFEQMGENLHGIHDVSHLVTAKGVGWISGMLRQLDKAKRTEIARSLFSQDPAKQEAAIRAIEEQMAYAASQKIAGDATRRVTGGLVGLNGEPIVQDFRDRNNF